nr:GNAT family N-acetyltransferase [Marinicella sp. W31]MDC2878178.1 GNAT family N-acetyltransferase [Marinicella sp. W31]
MTACAAILNDWIDETPWMPRIHDHADVERHYREHVFENCTVTIAAEEGEAVGFSTVSHGSFISALYLTAQARGRGIGTMLVNDCKAQKPTGLSLWTFVANRPARDFYGRAGFPRSNAQTATTRKAFPTFFWAGNRRPSHE